MLVSDRQLIGADQRIERRKEISVKAGTAYIKAHRFDESSAAYASRDYTKLGARFHKDGYIFIKNFLPKGLVTLAYEHLVCQLQQALPGFLLLNGNKLTATSECGWSAVGLLQRQGLPHHPLVLAVLENPRLADLAARLLEVLEVKTTNFKWLRAVARGHFTGLHTDRVFLGKNSDKLLTMWLPMHDIAPSEGAMLVCSGSHRSRAFSQLRRSYGSTSVGTDGTKSGWLTDDGSQLPDILRSSKGNIWGIDWRTAEFSPGDVLVLHQDTMHMTACNEASSFRVSCDTRWQPSEHPANPGLGSWKDVSPSQHLQV